MKNQWFNRAAKGVALVVVMIAALSWLVMSLWNWLLPGLFGWPGLSWLQALALLVLTRVLFGRLPGLGGRAGWRGQWRDKMRQRWQAMSPEEREQLRSRLHARKDWPRTDQE